MRSTILPGVATIMCTIKEITSNLKKCKLLLYLLRAQHNNICQHSIVTLFNRTNPEDAQFEIFAKHIVQDMYFLTWIIEPDNVIFKICSSCGHHDLDIKMFPKFNTDLTCL